MKIKVVLAPVLLIIYLTSCSKSCPCSQFAGWDYNHMIQVKKDLKSENSVYYPAYERLISDAGASLELGPFSVTFKEVTPPGGTKNDYMSMGPYWWPDTTKADGLPYIRRDGISNPQNGIDRAQYGNLVNATRNLSLAWFFTDNIQYAERASWLLKIWFIEPETRMNPHLEYGQAIPGRTAGRGIGIIDVRSMYTLVDAISLLEGSEALTTDEMTELKKWFSGFFTWLTTSQHGEDEDTYHNNHSVAYDVIVTSIARFLGNNEYVTKKISEVPARRIDPMIEPDGRQPEELIRTNAFGYSTGNLRNFFDAGQTGLKAGVNIFGYVNPEGGSLRGALDFLIKYIDRSEEWQWQQIGGWERSENNLGLLIRSAARFYDEPEYKKLWDERFSEKMKSDWSLLVTPGL